MGALFFNVGTERRQRPFRMISCRGGFCDPRPALRLKASEEHCALHLRAWNLGNEINPGEVGAVNRNWRTVVVRRLDACAHARERSDDAAHRTAAQGSIAA
jgi:hypothetical protein